MSDEQQTGGVRRFSRKDRKRSLDTRGPLFPPEDPIEASSPATEETEPPAAEVAEPETAIAPPAPAKVPKAVARPAPKTTPVRRAPTTGKSVIANLLTLVFLLGTFGMIAAVVIITQNPYSALNPFPPFTPLPIVITATFLPPTETPIGTAAPTATFTPLPVDTGNAAPENTAQAVGFNFTLASAQPIYAPNANDKACNWSSIAGTVTDSKGTALDGYRVHVTGNGIDETVFSGAALTFGAGGFELFLNGTPQAKTYTVQLSDPQSRPLSQAYTVETKASCDQNVAVLQFVQLP